MARREKPRAGDCPVFRRIGPGNYALVDGGAIVLAARTARKLKQRAEAQGIHYGVPA